MSGTLEVTIICARNLKKQDGLLGSNDPYVILKLGGQKFKTEIKKDAGKECTWNQTFQLGITEKMTEMKLEVYDQDPVADDTIGKTSIPLGGVISSQVVDAWYTIGKGSSSTGEIRVMLRFKPGAFPAGFDPNASTFDDGVKVAAGVAGGALAAAALGYGAKMAYDHYNKKSDQGQQPHSTNQSQNVNSPGNALLGSSQSQPNYGSQQYGGQPQSGHGSQPQYNYGNQTYGGQPQGGYGSQSQGGSGQPQGSHGNQQGYGQHNYPSNPNSGNQSQQFSGGFMMPPSSGNYNQGGYQGHQ